MIHPSACDVRTTSAFRAMNRSMKCRITYGAVTQPANNTVHCEFFRPLAPGKHPGVVVLHILGGDFDLSRLFCRSLASRNVAALFVKMPHYGPRREPGSTARMVSLDPRETVRGMTQAVLDVRRAAAWLGAQESVDPEQLGIMGISLGGITSALAATAVAWRAAHQVPARTRAAG